jgi:hypothetical protein
MQSPPDAAANQQATRSKLELRPSEKVWTALL